MKRILKIALQIFSYFWSCASHEWKFESYQRFSAYY